MNMFDEAMNIKKWNKKDKIFQDRLDEVYRTLDFCDVYFIENVGFVILNFEPTYGIYKRLNIPEIQDVYVVSDCRGQGFATALIAHCERQVEGDMVGISVPVSPAYGPAQRLYYKLGYQPDGNGVTYERALCHHGDRVCLDDDLCLMMIKQL